MTTPNADCLKGRMLGARWDARTNPTHFYYFSAKSLTALLRRAGFEEIEEWTLFTSYPHHGVLRRILQRILVTRGLQGGLVFVASVVNGIPSSGRGKFASRPAEIHLETSGALR